MPRVFYINTDLGCCFDHNCCGFDRCEDSVSACTCNRTERGTGGHCLSNLPQCVAAGPHCRIVCPSDVAGRRGAQRAVSTYVHGHSRSTR